MKTKIALLVTVVTSILFWGGCASTELTDVKTYKLSELATDDGVWHSKLSNSRKPITCRVVEMIGGELRTEFFVKKGLKHGPYRKWHTQNDKVMAGYKHKDSVYENGELVKHKEFAHTYRDDAFKDSKELQIEIPGWNRDGSPKK